MFSLLQPEVNMPSYLVHTLYTWHIKQWLWGEREGKAQMGAKHWLAIKEIGLNCLFGFTDTILNQILVA